jgi:RNA polymerase-binding transcription factor DksA
MDEKFIFKMNEKLLAEKERLQKLIHKLADPETTERVTTMDHVVKYQDIGTDVGAEDENVHERENYEVALSAAGSLEDQLDAVTAALERIDTDAYGVCAKCGEEIPETRLEANPSATECIGCSEDQTQ